MKKTGIILLMLAFFGSMFSQNYNQSDKEGLKKILRQQGTAYKRNAETGGWRVAFPNTPVFSLNGLTEADTLTWDSSEAWIEKLTAHLEWSETSPKKLLVMRGWEGVDNMLFDLSDFQKLTDASLSVSDYSLLSTGCPIKVDASKNVSLKELSIRNATLVGGFAEGNQIEVFSGDISPANLRLLPKLKKFGGYAGSDANFSYNPLLEKLSMWGNEDIKTLTLDLSINSNLKTLELASLMKLHTIKFPIESNLEDLNLRILYSMTDLDLSNSSKLLRVSIADMNMFSPDRTMTGLRTIKWGNTESIQSLKLSKLYLSFSSLPTTNIPEFIYDAEGIRCFGEMTTDQTLDMRREHEIDGQITQYVWREQVSDMDACYFSPSDDYNEFAKKLVKQASLDPIVSVENRDGQFTFPANLVGKKIYCTMQNPRFPDMTIYVFVQVKAGAVSQVYNQSDKEGLKKILRQRGTAYKRSAETGFREELPNTSVFSVNGLTEADTLTWDSSEAWVEKLTTHLEWSETSPKKLLVMRGWEGVDNMFFDLSDFQQLSEGSFYVSNYTIMGTGCPVTVDASKNVNLKYLSLWNNGALVGGFSESNQIEVFSGIISPADLRLLTKLKKFEGYAGSDVNFSANPLLEKLSFYSLANGPYLDIKTIDLSTSTNLKTLFLSSLIDVHTIKFPIESNLEDLTLSSLYSMTDLDLSNSSKLLRVSITDINNLFGGKKGLQTIKWGNTESIQYLKLSNLSLAFSSIPTTNIPEFICNTGGLRCFGEMTTDQTLDMSRESEIDGHMTEYVWREVYDSPCYLRDELDDPNEFVKKLSKAAVSEPIVHVENKDGRFTFPANLVGKNIYCTMQNPRFPDMTFYVFVDVKAGAVSQVYNQSDKEGLRNLMRLKGIAHEELSENNPAITKSNFELYGLTAADTLNWYVDETWVETVSNKKLQSTNPSFSWDESSPKRIVAANIELGVGETSAWDFSPFSELESLSLNIRKYGVYSFNTEVKISESNSKLKNVFTYNGSVTGSSSATESLSVHDEILASEVLVDYPNLKSLDLSEYYENIDLSQNPLLETLNIGGGVGADLELSLNKKLRTISIGKSMNNASPSKVSFLDLTENTDLEELDLVGFNELAKLDLSNNPKLKKLSSVDAFALENLDLSACNDLERISLIISNAAYSTDGLNSLKLGNTNKLQYLNLSNNAFLLSDLPAVDVPEYIRGSQGVNYLGRMKVGEKIDLSTEYMFNGVASEFAWEDVLSTENLRPGDISQLPNARKVKRQNMTHTNGVFTITSDLIGKTVMCYISNPSLPGARATIAMAIDATTDIIPNDDAEDTRLTSSLVHVGEPIELIVAEQAVVSIYNSLGQIIASTKLTDGTNELAGINVTGIYTLNVKLTNGTSKVFKLIVR